jgi:hypothetical protein
MIPRTGHNACIGAAWNAGVRHPRLADAAYGVKIS